MNLKSPKITIDKSAKDVFDFLGSVRNFEKLMPENISKFEVINTDTFAFALKGMPEIILKLKNANPPSRIELGAAGGKIDFGLNCDITEIQSDKSEVQLEFNGDFNPMMAMMVKGPISKFIETLSANIPKAI